MQTRPQIKNVLKRSAFLIGIVRAARAALSDLRVLRGMAFRPARIRAYLNQHETRKLQLGASNSRLPGWLSTDVVPESLDVVYLDATRSFPFNDDVFDYVACEHMIEHIEYSGALVMLRESFRVIKPGGKIRIATPDLRVITRLCAEEKSEAQKQYILWAAGSFAPETEDCKAVFVVNNFFRSWGHQFLYDSETLKAAMTRCGFEDLKCYKPGVSEDVNLRGIESHGIAIGSEEMNQFETFVIEGVVPNLKQKPNL